MCHGGDRVLLQERLRHPVQERGRGQPGGGRPRTLRLLRRDRSHAGQAPSRHRHCRGASQVCQAGQGEVRESSRAVLGHPQAEHPAVQQLRVAVRVRRLV